MHQVDGLRATACLLVLFSHAMNRPVVSVLRDRGLWYLAELVSWVGQSGVELFFVLSGIVLLMPYVRGVRPFRSGQYVRRRVERLFPPYLACLFATVPLLVVAGLFPTWYSREILPPFRWRDLVCQLGIINPGAVTYNAAWWSLQVEIIFYALVPLLAYVLARTRIVPGIAILIWIVLTVFSHIELYRYQPRLPATPSLPELFVLYAPCFFVGTCLSKLDLGAGVGYALVLIGAIWILLVPLAGGYTQFRSAYPVLYAGVLVLAFQPKHLLRDLLSHPLMVWIGERSYSIFLIHFTTFYATNYVVSLVCPSRTLAYGLATRLIGIPLAFYLAMLLFHFVERRFARGLVSGDYFWPTINRPR